MQTYSLLQLWVGDILWACTGLVYQAQLYRTRCFCKLIDISSVKLTICMSTGLYMHACSLVDLGLRYRTWGSWLKPQQDPNSRYAVCLNVTTNVPALVLTLYYMRALCRHYTGAASLYIITWGHYVAIPLELQHWWRIWYIHPMPWSISGPTSFCITPYMQWLSEIPCFQHSICIQSTNHRELNGWVSVQRDSN